MNPGSDKLARRQQERRQLLRRFGAHLAVTLVLLIVTGILLVQMREDFHGGRRSGLPWKVFLMASGPAMIGFGLSALTNFVRWLAALMGPDSPPPFASPRDPA